MGGRVRAHRGDHVLEHGVSPGAERGLHSASQDHPEDGGLVAIGDRGMAGRDVETEDRAKLKRRDADAYGAFLRELIDGRQTPEEMLTVQDMPFIVYRCMAADVSVISTRGMFDERRWYHRRQRGRLYGPFVTADDAWIDAVRVHGVKLD